MVLVCILKVQLIRVILRGDASCSKCLTSCSRLLGTSELVLSKSYLLDLLRTPVLCEGLLFWSLPSPSCILDIPLPFGGSYRVFEWDSCGLHVNFLLDHFIWLFVDAFMEIVPELIFFSLSNSLFDWFQLSLLMLRCDQVSVTLGYKFVLLEVWLKGTRHLVSAYHLIWFLWSWCPSTTIVLRQSYLPRFVGWLIAWASICLRAWVKHCNITCLKWINRLLWLIKHRFVFLGPDCIRCTSNRIEHVVKFAWVHIFLFSLILHLLNHFIDTWLLKITLPELQDPLISLLDCLFPQMHRSLSWIMAF